MVTLNNLTAWVSGASSGVGYATAKLLAEHGAHVIAVARRLEKLEQLRDDSEKHAQGKITPLAMDITNEHDFKEKAQSILEQHGVDILVSNAGLMLTSELDELATDDWRRMIELNCMGTLNMVNLLYPTMIKQQSGHIVTVGSVNAFRTVQGNAVYAMTKFGLRGFTDALRKEAIKHGIRVGEILPGGIDTELRTHITSQKILDRIQAGEIGNISKRLEAIDIANSICFMLQQPKHANIGSIVIRPFESIE